mgnify:CR=1 FL=1
MKASFFEADRTLVETAMAVCREVNPDIEVYEGRVLSGDQFISNNDKKNWLISTFDGSCTEMEGAAIAQTAYRNNLPFVILRAISDKADDSAQMDYPTFERIAAHRCAEVTRSLARQLQNAWQNNKPCRKAGFSFYFSGAAKSFQFCILAFSTA